MSDANDTRRETCDGCGFNRLIVKRVERGKRTYAICEYCKNVPEGRWMFPPKRGAPLTARKVPKEAPEPALRGPGRSRHDPAVTVALERAAKEAFDDLQYRFGWWVGFGYGACAAATVIASILLVAYVLGWIRA